MGARVKRLVLIRAGETLLRSLGYSREASLRVAPLAGGVPYSNVFYDARVRDARVRDARVRDARVRDARVRDAKIYWASLQPDFE